MKRTKVESALERQFLVGLATDKAFLAAVAPLLTEETLPLLKEKYARQLAGWCTDFFRQYDAAPGAGLDTVYRAWRENDKPEESEADAVGDLLDSLPIDDPQPINAPHLAAEFAGHLTNRRIEQLNDTLTSHLSYGRREEALNAIQAFRSVTAGEGVGYTFAGKDAVNKTFAELSETVIPFSGSCGDFFGDAFSRDNLVGLQAPEKRGKTFWLIEFAIRAIRGRRRVAFFQTGDLSKSQINRRLFVRWAATPSMWKYCHKVRMPVKIELEKGPEGIQIPKVDYSDMSFPEPLTKDAAYLGKKKFWKRVGVSPDNLKMSVHANSSINVTQIDAILKRWRTEEDWTADIVIIDYADILAPENPRFDPREHVNETWKRLRRLSQEWHALVISPTQANADSYSARTQTMRNFSNDKRKNAHVTAMLGLNQTREEKEAQVMRLNWLALREDDFNPSRCLWVAQCLPLGLPNVKSIY